MNYPGTQSAGDAVLRVLAERELAEWRIAEGVRVAEKHGRWWEEIKPGFYQPIHWLARHRRSEVERPAALCWGFRTTLHDADREQANGSLPVHVLQSPSQYEVDALSGKRKNKLRKCRKRTQIVQVIEPTLLRDHGYDVRLSVTERLRIWKPPSRSEYEKGLDVYVHPNRFILAGLAEKELLAYLDAFAVDGVAYIDHVYIKTSAMKTEVGTGLVFDLVQACRRSAGIREIVYGLDIPSNQSLRDFKAHLGFPVTHVPALYWFLQPTDMFVRWWRPEVYYRLTGRAPNARGATLRMIRSTVRRLEARLSHQPSRKVGR